MTAALDWTHALSEVAANGLSHERAATAAELASLAVALGIPEAAEVTARYEIRPRAGGRCRLSGDLAAKVIQECVVTLASVPARVEESFDVEFWPRDAPPLPPNGDIELLSSRDVEPIDGNVIDVGRIVFETLAAALDPYPRAPGAAFDWSDPRETGNGKPAGPFAGLAALKPKA